SAAGAAPAGAAGLRGARAARGGPALSTRPPGGGVPRGDGRRALVLGLGRFGGGVEAARFLARRGWRLRVADRATEASLADSVRALGGLGVEWRLGSDDEAVLDDVELVVVNP